jgi:hypothetical protein
MKIIFKLILIIGLMLGVGASPGLSSTINLTPTLDVYSTPASGSNLPATNSVDLIGGLDYNYPYHQGYRPYFQFNLDAIPDNNIITSATLTLACWYFSGTPTSFNLYRIASDAAVTPAMTWNTQPATDTTPVDTQWISSTGSKTWNLLASGQWDFTADLTDNLLSLQLRVADESVNSDTWAKFRSANYNDINYAPLLTLNYEPPLPPVETPIPSAVWLLGSGLLSLVLWRKSKA